MCQLYSNLKREVWLWAPFYRCGKLKHRAIKLIVTLAQGHRPTKLWNQNLNMGKSGSRLGSRVWIPLPLTQHIWFGAFYPVCYCTCIKIQCQCCEEWRWILCICQRWVSLFPNATEIIILSLSSCKELREVNLSKLHVDLMWFCCTWSDFILSGPDWNWRSWGRKLHRPQPESVWSRAPSSTWWSRNVRCLGLCCLLWVTPGPSVTHINILPALSAASTSLNHSTVLHEQFCFEATTVNKPTPT